MAVVVAVAVGGSGGALARFGLDSLIERHVDSLFPWATFTINISGCFLNGLLVAVVVDQLGAPSWLSRGLIVGFLGAYTTFSTMAVETVTLVKDGRALLGIAYLCFSIVAGLAAAYAGIISGRKPTTRC